MWSKTYQCHVLLKHQPFSLVKSLSALIQQCFAKISEILFSFLGWMLEIRLFEIKFNHCLAELIYFHTLLSQLVIAHLIWEPISYCLICRYLFTEIRGWLANHTFVLVEQLLIWQPIINQFIACWWLFFAHPVHARSLLLALNCLC